jgi:hypothetical protein
MTKSVTLLGGLLLLSLALAASAYIIFVVDPLKWGLVQSERFTWEEFGKVKRGDQIESVVERLGQPVRPAENFAVLTEDSRDPCAAGGCKKYIFAGAIWGATFKEAIVIADPRGNVIHAVTRQE